MEYEDDKGMESILILSKILMKAYAERTNKYEHPFGIHRDFEGGVLKSLYLGYFRSNLKNPSSFAGLGTSSPFFKNF